MYTLGIDLGGTNIVAGVVNESYKIVSTAQRKTAMPRPAELIADDMAAACLDAVAQANLTLGDISWLGVGTPGAVEGGIVTFANNLDFHNTPLAALMETRLHLPVYLENDANAAAYGEALDGAGRGVRDLVAVTLGTGFGSGVIIDGKIYGGFNHAAPELGHLVIEVNGVQCTCGRRGCLEQYAAATGLIRLTKESMREHPESRMWALCGGDIETVSGRTAFNAQREGDPAGDAVVKLYIEYLGGGLASIINAFQPEILCIGGGISNEGENLLAPLRAIVDREDYAKAASKRTRVVRAELGNAAGLIGAAMLGKLYGKA